MGEKSLAQRARLDTSIAHYLFHAVTGQGAFAVLHRLGQHGLRDGRDPSPNSRPVNDALRGSP
jgi:hypothetical protein